MIAVPWAAATAKYEAGLLDFAFYPGAGEKSLTEFIYLGLAVAGEAGEFTEIMDKLETPALGPSIYAQLQDEILLELGDVLWYTTRILNTCDIKLSDAIRAQSTGAPPREANDPDVGIAAYAGLIADVVKKMMRDGTTTPRQDRIDAVLAHAMSLLRCLIRTAGENGTDIYGIMKLNREKLEARNAKGAVHDDRKRT